MKTLERIAVSYIIALCVFMFWRGLELLFYGSVQEVSIVDSIIYLMFMPFIYYFYNTRNSKFGKAVRLFEKEVMYKYLDKCKKNGIKITWYDKLFLKAHGISTKDDCEQCLSIIYEKLHEL